MADCEPDDPREALQALGPKKAVVDGDSVETHSISDLIAWDRYKRVSCGKTSPFKKVWRVKFTQPGPQSRFDAPECSDS